MNVPWLPVRGTAAMLAALFLCTVSFAQGSKTAKAVSGVSIQVAGEDLRLGMTKAQIAEKLLGAQVKKVDADNWNVGRSEDWLQFTNGVLTFAERHWTDEIAENTDRGIAGDLYYAVQSLNQNDGLSHCTITSGMDDNPSLTKKWVSIACELKSIIVFKRTFGGHTYDSVEEHLGNLR